MDWITELTSISVSALMGFLDGGMSEIVDEVEIVRGDGLCDHGDTVKVEGGCSLVMGMMAWDWGSLSLISTT